MRKQINKRISTALDAQFVEGEGELIQKCIDQIKDYSHKKIQTFDLPLLMLGTEFQKSIWNLLLDIPYGTTKTYMQLAKALGNTAAIRAVGTANGANAISIIVPCHRIVGSDGNLVGYAGGLSVKKKLLKHEGAQLISTQAELF